MLRFLSPTPHPASSVAIETPNQRLLCPCAWREFRWRRWNAYGTMAHLGVPVAPILITPFPRCWLMETLSGLLGSRQTSSTVGRNGLQKEGCFRFAHMQTSFEAFSPLVSQKITLYLIIVVCLLSEFLSASALT